MPGPGRNPAIDPTLSNPPRWRTRLPTNAKDNSVNTRTLRSIICNCSSRSKSLASPTKPKPALLTTNCGSARSAARVPPISWAAPFFERSATITMGRGAPVASISAASACNLSSRRADAGGGARNYGDGARVCHVFIISARVYHEKTKTSRLPALLKISARREVTREYRLLDKFLRIEGPELTHLWIGLDNGVGELSVYPRHFADVDIENRRAIFVEPHRTNRPMSQAGVVHRFEESRRVISLTAGGFQRLLDNEKRRVRAGGVKARIVLVGLIDTGNEFLVVRRVETGGVPAPGNHANAFLTHHAEDAFVGASCVAEHSNFSLQSEFAELF